MTNKDAYPLEFKDRAVALNRSSGRSMDAIAKELGISSTSLANENRQAAIDAGEKPGIFTDDRAETMRLRRNNRRLELENEILKKAAAHSARENVVPKGLTDRSRSCNSRSPGISGFACSVGR